MKFGAFGVTKSFTFAGEMINPLPVVSSIAYLVRTQKLKAPAFKKNEDWGALSSKSFKGRATRPNSAEYSMTGDGLGIS